MSTTLASGPRHLVDGSSSRSSVAVDVRSVARGISTSHPRTVHLEGAATCVRPGGRRRARLVEDLVVADAADGAHDPQVGLDGPERAERRRRGFLAGGGGDVVLVRGQRLQRARLLGPRRRRRADALRRAPQLRRAVVELAELAAEFQFRRQQSRHFIVRLLPQRVERRVEAFVQRLLALGEVDLRAVTTAGYGRPRTSPKFLDGTFGNTLEGTFLFPPRAVDVGLPELGVDDGEAVRELAPFRRDLGRVRRARRAVSRGRVGLAQLHETVVPASGLKLFADGGRRPVPLLSAQRRRRDDASRPGRCASAPRECDPVILSRTETPRRSSGSQNATPSKPASAV